MGNKSLLQPSRWRAGIRDRVLIAAIALIAAMLRLWRLDQVPPGLFHDEAFNGLDVLRVLAGWHPIYFPGNYGREPLYLYLVAGSVAVLGRAPGAIRIVSALLGTLTIPAAYLAARELFNRRIGLLTAVITAITLWHVALSRVGFRAISLPLISALAIWQGALAWRTDRARHWILAGALGGLTLYTYLAARLVPIALVLFAVWCFIVTRAGRARKEKEIEIEIETGDRDREGAGRRRVWIGMLAALVVAAPLGVYALDHWDEMFLRAGQVSVFNPQISDGNPWRLLAQQALDTATMFVWRGDANPRHNVPGRAVFDPGMALMFILGVVVCVKRIIVSLGQSRVGDQGPYTLTLIWTCVMLLPSILADHAPSFLRAIGALPIVFIIPAIGLDAAWSWFDVRGRPGIGAAAVGALLSISLLATTLTYLGPYSTSRELHQAFDASPVEMAVDVNRWLGIGWQGQGLAARSGPATPGRYVWIDPALWKFSIAVPFLVTELPTQSTRLRFTPVTAIPADADAIKLVVLPTQEDALASLPRGWRIRAGRGTTVGGVPGQEPFLLYVSFEAEPAREVSVLARFGESIELVSQEVRAGASGRVMLHTEWRATRDIQEDWTMFAHLVRDGQIVAQNDGPPAEGLLPTSQWRAGDVIVDERELAGPLEAARDKIRVGFYRPDTGARLMVVDAAGRLTRLDYWVVIP